MPTQKPHLKVYMTESQLEAVEKAAKRAGFKSASAYGLSLIETDLKARGLDDYEVMPGWGKAYYSGSRGEAFIDIWNCQASIAREVWETDSKSGRYGYNVYCTNADELMDDILAEIERQGGAIDMSGRMRCPAELATRAKWEAQGDE